MSLLFRAEVYWADILDHVKRHFFDLTFFWFPKVAGEEHQPESLVIT